MTPSSYRAGGAGETIVYAVRATWLGPLLMAATNRGVCCAQFGDSAAALLARLQAEFERARIIASSMTHSPELDAWMAAFETHIDGAAPCPELPLDLRGTAFQIRVWRFLLAVPEGEVVSWYRVIGCCGAMGGSAAIGGVWSANERCSSVSGQCVQSLRQPC